MDIDSDSCLAGSLLGENSRLSAFGSSNLSEDSSNLVDRSQIRRDRSKSKRGKLIEQVRAGLSQKLSDELERIQNAKKEVEANEGLNKRRSARLVMKEKEQVVKSTKPIVRRAKKVVETESESDLEESETGEYIEEDDGDIMGNIISKVLQPRVVQTRKKKVVVDDIEEFEGSEQGQYESELDDSESTSESSEEEVVHRFASKYGPVQRVEETEYEVMRRKKMEENAAVLQELGMNQVAKSLVENAVDTIKTVTIKAKTAAKRRQSSYAALKRKYESIGFQRRKSPRLHEDSKEDVARTVGGDYDSASVTSKENAADVRVIKKFADIIGTDDDVEEKAKLDFLFAKSLEDTLFTCEEYFNLRNKFIDAYFKDDSERGKEFKSEVKLVQARGEFSGWVNEDIRRACGIAEDSNAAWEENGGGKFSFKNPDGKSVSGPKDSAKEMARKMLKKNPNSYFYRHTAPGRDHWQGDWTEPENELFLQTARKYGVGTKWGLFATNIPNRVGYQCSNHYRAHFIGTGIIYDDNFRFNKNGETIYVGFKNRRA